MARQLKEGLDFFSFDVDFFDDEKRCNFGRVRDKRRNYGNKAAMCGIQKWILHYVE